MNESELFTQTEDLAADWLPPEAPLSMPPQVLARRQPGRRLAVFVRLLLGRQSA